MKLLHVASYPTGPRCWVMGQRVHHGTIGAALVACAVVLADRRRASRVLGLVGLALIAHDRADRRVWFSREGLDRPLSTV